MPLSLTQSCTSRIFVGIIVVDVTGVMENVGMSCRGEGAISLQVYVVKVIGAWLTIFSSRVAIRLAVCDDIRDLLLVFVRIQSVVSHDQGEA